jgi:hypothetical protein
MELGADMPFLNMEFDALMLLPNLELDAKKKHNFILDYNFHMLSFKED